MSSESVMDTSGLEFMAAPTAANRCECPGSMMASPVRLSVRINAFFSSGRKWRGPPRNATFPLIGLPHARPDIV